MLSQSKNYQTESRAVPCRILYRDGTEQYGSIVVPRQSNFSDVLESSGPFLKFVTEDGEKSFLATGDIRSVNLIGMAKAKPLDARKREKDEPYRILKVTPDAQIDEVKQAYHKMSKQYHPDRFISLDPPEEVIEYLNSMTQVVNQAFGIVKKKLAVQVNNS